MQVWAEPVPDAPEPQGCAATLGKDAAEEEAKAPASPANQRAIAAAQAAPGLGQQQFASSAPHQPAHAEQGQHVGAPPSQHGKASQRDDVSQQAQQAPAAQSSQEPEQSADAKDAIPPHPLLSIAPASSTECKATSSAPSLHPLLQVGLAKENTYPVRCFRSYWTMQPGADFMFAWIER